MLAGDVHLLPLAEHEGSRGLEEAGHSVGGEAEAEAAHDEGGGYS